MRQFVGLWKRKMGKNIFEIIGKNVRDKKFKKKEANKRYWKLPATERLHYDSIMKNMEEKRVNFLAWTTMGFKLMVVLPLFIIFLGYMLGNEKVLFDNSVIILIGLIKIMPVFFVIDILNVIVDIYWNSKEKLKINKQFGLVKFK